MTTIGTPGYSPLTGPQPGLDPSLVAPPDEMGQDTFLKLLVAQLKYQNPLDPMDGTQFMAQTAQFTTVEKLTELTKQLGESLGNDRMATATGMIGRDVTYTGLDGREASGVVAGVRLQVTGPVLLLGDGAEVAMAQVSQVTAAAAPATAPAPLAIQPAPPVAAVPSPTTDPDPTTTDPTTTTDDTSTATDGDPSTPASA